MTYSELREAEELVETLEEDVANGHYFEIDATNGQMLLNYINYLRDKPAYQAAEEG